MQILSIVNQNGPLPVKAAFEAPLDGPAVFAVSGTVWSSGTNTPVGFQVALDGETIAQCMIYANPSTTHMAVPTQFVQAQLSSGQHVVTLSALTGETEADQNDFFSVTLLY